MRILRDQRGLLGGEPVLQLRLHPSNRLAALSFKRPLHDGRARNHVHDLRAELLCLVKTCV